MVRHGSRRLAGAKTGMLGVGTLALIGSVIAQTLPTVQLSAEPLFARTVKPTLTLLLSVEYPTAGAAYVDSSGYALSREYVGYFDPNGCYAYDKAQRYFTRAASASAHACDGTKFSGNFMNWATTSAIDVLRYGLTGGDRLVDDIEKTVLQRAVLPPLFYNNARYFTPKYLAPDLAKGAVPQTLLAGNTGQISLSNCMDRIYFGTAVTGTCDAPGNSSNLGGTLNSDGFFYARVEVCSVGDAAARPALCDLQRSGYYKPVGNLQRHSNQLRVAVFGYLKDDTKLRYGGVLRAPMKYVGPKTFDDNFKLVAGLNTAHEWNETTGQFRPNPDGAAEGRSGAINYINQFGRSGNYKLNDPASELYYEALRYLQGLPPTPQATVNMRPEYKDGFPVYTQWTDPHPPIAGHDVGKAGSYACVVNNLLGVGDVRTNADKSLPGNTVTEFDDFVRAARPDYNEPDLVSWTRLVGGFETGAAMPYVDGQGVARTTSNPSTRNNDNANLDTKQTPWLNGAGFYIVGAAYWASTHDIRPKGLGNYAAALARPGMRTRTYMIDVNEEGVQTPEKAFKQNQFYLAAKYGGFTDRSQTGNPFLGKDGVTLDNTNWSRQVPSSVAKDTMTAKTYFQGNEAAGLLAALDNIFSAVMHESASIANAAVASTRLATETALFHGGVDSSDWSGDLVRYRLTYGPTGSAVIASATDPTTLSAAALLDKLASTDTRKIFVGRRSPDARGAANEFKWDSLDGDQRDALRTPPPPTPSDDEAMGRLRLAYLRGDRSQEANGVMRHRSSRLGDIVNAGAVFSGRPSNLVGDSSYTTFAAAQSRRPDTVFVGANDGMMHAFNATTMAELFAYIPNAVMPRLRDLTLPTYVHRSYVDATPVVSEAKVGTTWKTVLVSGMGGGGQGVFALDVSNPATFDAKRVMWEFSDRDDPSMGNVIGRPRVLKLCIGDVKGIPTYKWFAVVASGVNNAVNDGYASTTGQAAIFLLDLAKRPEELWRQGTNYFKVELTSSDTSKATGIVGFSVVEGPACELQLLYAGDLQGNLWKLIFANTGQSSWSAVGLAATAPFFKTADPTGAPQPITGEPEIAFGPKRGYIVSFGTGKFLELSDLVRPFQTQTFYAVYDNRVVRVGGRSYMKPATLTANGKIETAPFAWGVPGNPAQSAVRAGWYFDFPRSADGERQVSGLSMTAGTVVFSTVEPPANGCAEGSGRVYVADLASASGQYANSTVGLMGEPLLLKIGVDTLSNATSTGRAAQSTRYQIITPGSSGIKVSELNPAIPPQTVLQRSWRQVFNFEEMRSKP